MAIRKHRNLLCVIRSVYDPVRGQSHSEYVGNSISHLGPIPDALAALLTEDEYVELSQTIEREREIEARSVIARAETTLLSVVDRLAHLADAVRKSAVTRIQSRAKKLKGGA